MTDDEIIQMIEELRDEILIHSYIYYELDDSVISDYEYDKKCKQLAELQEQYPKLAEESSWHEFFHDFDGSTGFHLPKNSPYIIKRAEEL